VPWQEVGDRVFAWRFPFLDQQIGVVLGGRDVMVVDTRSTPVQAREVADLVRELTRDPISVVVDTHWHWDHAFGNNALRPAAIWGHVRTVDRLRTSGPAIIEEVAREMPAIADDIRRVVIDPPERTFTDTARVELGDRLVELSYHGLAHTDTDIVAVVPDAAVLFAGDLVEAEAPPSFGDSYPVDWPDTVERVLPLITGAVVPGHGPVGDRRFVEEQLADFRAIADLARRVHAGELDLESALEIAPFAGEAARDALDRGLAQVRGELDDRDLR
jgi:glyoxylase-like metal-dependent hydrolase (beta-lactamase superfamily II)